MLTTGANEDDTYKLGNKYLLSFPDLYASKPLPYERSRRREGAEPEGQDRLRLFGRRRLEGGHRGGQDAGKGADGLDVVFDEAYVPSANDFGPIINKVISSGAETLMEGGHYADAGARTVRFDGGHLLILQWGSQRSLGVHESSPPKGRINNISQSAERPD